MEEKYTQELAKSFSDDFASPSQTINSGHVKMIGLSDVFAAVKDESTRIIRPFEFGYFSFLGSAGSGRSILAKSVYEDIHVNKAGSFDCGAWVTIGSTYNLKRILLHIIYQINDIENLEPLTSEGEEELGKYLYKSLEGRRYIVSLDDVCNTDILIQLRRSFPEQNNGSLVFVATSLIEVAEFDESFFAYTLPTILDEEYVSKYIRVPFFGENEPISPEFEEIVRKIAKNCHGNRLVVARIMLLLRKMKKLPENWGAIAADEHNRIYEVHDEISEATRVQKNLGQEDQVWAKELLDVSILNDRVKENLYPDRLFPNMGIMTLYGMAGIGKTTLMKKLFQDPAVLRRFDHHSAWVNVGMGYDSDDIVIDILAQIYPCTDKRAMKGDAKLVQELCLQLSCKKCFIVLDDLWSQEPVHLLKKALPDIKGQLMVTTTLTVGVALFGPCDRTHKLRLLDKEESWDVLREKVFGEEICPFQLEKAGKKIAENCEGLPLLILTVADKLLEYEKTVKYWNMVANGEDGKEPIVMKAQIEVSESLALSYENLAPRLKACFLYMGVFPRSHKIFTSKLMKLWIVEGFLEPNPPQTIEEVASRCLKELVDSNMVMVNKGSDLETSKICYLHSVSWHLSNIEANKINFFYTLKPNDDIPMEFCEKQQRLCIRHSILLGIESDAVTAFSSIHSLLCTGPPHQYPVPLSYDAKLLKVLEALGIRFYEFPIEVVRLLQLRYLALTCDGNLPPSVSNLWNLQFLIVQKHLSIKSSFISSYLPKEIWDMKKLKHLHVSGSKLPDPENEALLPTLLTLLDVSVHCCNERVFKGMPNLKKLGIQIELEPNDNSNPIHYLDHISHLSKLESLKCVVVNPDLGFVPPNPCSMLPSSLRKLSLSGLGYSWKYMSIIGKLQNLEVLKLRCYAFVGPTWEMDAHEFSKLKFLSIEDTDLVRWDLGRATPYNLQFLNFKHCYNLEQLPSHLPDCIKMIEVVESHPSCEDWAEQMKENNWERRVKNREFSVQSSRND